MSRALVSGRVMHHERIRDALLRHIEKDLGPVALPIPNNLSLLGFQIHSQAVAFEPLPNGFAVALSDANSLTIGAR